MKLNVFLRLFFIQILSSFLFSCNYLDNDLTFTGKYSPLYVGNRVVSRYLELPFRDYGTIDSINPEYIIYPEVCTWYGALKFSEISENSNFLSMLKERYEDLVSYKSNLMPPPDHVDNSVFGCIPLTLYTQTGEKKFLETGLSYADIQWKTPQYLVFSEDIKQMIENGLSWQSRFWIDDMYMISVLQLEAFRATKDRKYLDRTVNEMIVYLDSIQQPNGLFYHASDIPFYWGRGNGWMAVGMAEVLKELPLENLNRTIVLKCFCKMMNSLKEYQHDDGLWGQLIDDPESWTETSGSAMFIYAMIIGIKEGWLDKNKYVPVVQKGWKAVVERILCNGDLLGVCQATNKKNSKQYYLERECYPGDLHGQAAVLWCATALLNN